MINKIHHYIVLRVRLFYLGARKGSIAPHRRNSVLFCIEELVLISKFQILIEVV